MKTSRSFKHRFCFYVNQVLRFRTRLITAPFWQWTRKLIQPIYFEGIRIVDLSPRRGIDRRFRDDTIAALNLIQSADPQRFARIQREIECIANTGQVGLASYDRPLKECAIEYERMKSAEYPEWAPWCYATVLVHEATHGALYSRHIAYTKALRMRIERLCHKEQMRFAKRTDPSHGSWSETLDADFNEEALEEYWAMSRLEMMSLLIKKLWKFRKRIHEYRQTDFK